MGIQMISVIEKWEPVLNETVVRCCQCGWETAIDNEYLHDTEFIKCECCNSWEEFEIKGQE